MKKILFILALLLCPLSGLGQTGAIQGTSTLGGISATTQGAQSSNKLLGVIPAAKISIYLTGTQTLATLTSDGTHSLSNPFYSNASNAVNPGGYIAFVSTNTGYDVVASSGQGTPNCTTGPMCYTQPVTLCKDCFASSQFVAPGVVSIIGANGPITCTGGSCNIAGQGAVLQHNGTNLADQALLNFLDAAPSLPAGYTPVTFSSNGAGGLGGYIPPINVASGVQMDIVPPIGGQYVVIYPTGASTTQTGHMTTRAGNTSGQISYPLNCVFGSTGTITWTGFTLPSYVLAANVTAVYAFDFSADTLGPVGGGGCLLPLAPVTANGTIVASGTGVGSPPSINGPGTGWTMGQFTGQMVGLTGANVSTAQILASMNISGDWQAGQSLGIPLVGLIVYYTGTAPPVNNSINVAPPLYFDPSQNLLSITPDATFFASKLFPAPLIKNLPLPAANTGVLIPVLDGASATDCTSGGGSTYVLCRSNGSAWVATGGGGGGTTTNALTANSSGGASPSDTFNGSAAKTWDYHTLGAQQALTLTTTGTSGAATLTGGALNIPQYSGGSGAFAGGLGTSYQDVTEIAAPANPAAGNDRLYTDSGTHKLACLTSGGADCMPTGGGSAGPQYGFTLNTGVAASPAFPNQIDPVTGTITACKFLTQASDGATALTFNIKLAGSSILSGSSATIAAGTASQTITTLTLTGSITVTAGNIWEFDITGGTSSWTGSLTCY